MKTNGEIVFTASLQGSACIKFDGDGAGSIRLAVPASDMPALARLLTMTEAELAVTVKLK